MKFEYNDGGRGSAGYKGAAGDCVARSVAIAADRPYADIYTSLSAGARTERASKRSKRMASARNGVHTSRKWFKEFMQSIGFVWTPTMLIGSGCKVHLHDGELPMGRLVVSLSRHYTAVIDGVIFDTHDPQREVHCTYHENGTQRHRIERRCVYGYWKLESAV